MEIEIDHTEEVHDEEESFICECCSKSFKHRSSLYRHLNAHKNELFKCNQCPKIFATRHYWNLHIGNVHTEPRNLLCPHCGRAYHTSCGGSNECSISERKFKDNYGLKRHLSSHEEKAQHCSICNKDFKNLKEHSKHCKKDKSEQRYSWHHCDKKYAMRRCLKVHIKIKPRNYSCISLLLWAIVKIQVLSQQTVIFFKMLIYYKLKGISNSYWKKLEILIIFIHTHTLLVYW